MENQNISRVHYFERQFLRTQDFSDEQAYHLEMMRRHQVAHHIWGIVRGLELALDPDCNPVLQPGIAVDGYGRTLVWQTGQPLPVGEFEAKGSDTLDAWLAYGEVNSDSAPDGYAGCVTGIDPGTEGSAAFYRIQEQPFLLLEVPDPTHPDPRMPPGVPDGDLLFDGTQNSPLSPTAFWPVYLGRVLRKREKPNQPWQYSVSLDGRPYAGLVGEMIIHPDDHARVEIGTPVGSEGKEARFAVFLNAPDQADPRKTLTDTDPRLEITSGGQINLRGDASLNGNLVLESGALIFTEQDGEPKTDVKGMDAPAGAPQPAAASTTQAEQPRPWTIYRAPGTVQVENAIQSSPQGKGEEQEGETQSASSQTQTATHDLRLEMAGNTKGENQVVIGAWAKGPDGKEAFQPCLTIDDECNVTVEHNLIVKGFIKQLSDKEVFSISGAPQETQAAQGMETAAFVSAATAAVSQAGQGDGPREITDAEIMALYKDENGRKKLVSIAMQDPVLFGLFMVALLEFEANDQKGPKAIAKVLDDKPQQMTDLYKAMLAPPIWKDFVTNFVEQLWLDADKSKLDKVLELIFAKSGLKIGNDVLNIILEVIVGLLLQDPDQLQQLNDLLRLIFKAATVQDKVLAVVVNALMDMLKDDQIEALLKKIFERVPFKIGDDTLTTIVNVIGDLLLTAHTPLNNLLAKIFAATPVTFDDTSLTEIINKILEILGGAGGLTKRLIPDPTKLADILNTLFTDTTTTAQADIRKAIIGDAAALKSLLEAIPDVNHGMDHFVEGVVNSADNKGQALVEAMLGNDTILEWVANGMKNVSQNRLDTFSRMLNTAVSGRVHDVLCI